MEELYSTVVGDINGPFVCLYVRQNGNKRKLDFHLNVFKLTKFLLVKPFLLDSQASIIVLCLRVDVKILLRE